MLTALKLADCSLGLVLVAAEEIPHLVDYRSPNPLQLVVEEVSLLSQSLFVVPGNLVDDRSRNSFTHALLTLVRSLLDEHLILCGVQLRGLVLLPQELGEPLHHRTLSFFGGRFECLLDSGSIRSGSGSSRRGCGLSRRSRCSSGCGTSRCRAWTGSGDTGWVYGVVGPVCEWFANV